MSSRSSPPSISAVSSAMRAPSSAVTNRTFRPSGEKKHVPPRIWCGSFVSRFRPDHDQAGPVLHFDQVQEALVAGGEPVSCGRPGGDRQRVFLTVRRMAYRKLQLV